MEFHYESEDGQAVCDADELVRLLIRGAVSLSTDVWTDGMEDWGALEDCPPELYEDD
eukprot:COSAG06_NODE_47742_length_337_cov_0.663866_1_plen_56_part_10